MAGAARLVGGVVPERTSVWERLIRLVGTGHTVRVTDAAIAAVVYSVVLLLRFADEGSVPSTYAARLVPWAILAAVIHVLVGIAIDHWRRPGRAMAGHPVAPYLMGAALALAAVLAVNYLALPLPWQLPRSVVALAPLFTAALCAAIRTAAGAVHVGASELLPRRLVELDLQSCAGSLADRRIVITGAAGSIGSELARQILRVHPRRLVLLDTNETGLFELEAELDGLRGSADVHPVIANVSDARRIDEVFRLESPDVVFHAAAYKHVPLVEANPEQGFITNVLGTLSVAEAAARHRVRGLVLISTDKAANPMSFMGLTKRAAELIVAAVGQRAPDTTFCAVRFGNVLGSRGSVVPTLLRQIDSGGPVTITHADVRRFFMTISEAASLVLRTAAFGEKGAVFVLDMGEQMRVDDLAKRLVRLRGLRPNKDIPFVYLGLRPGEKLEEELAGDGEELVETEHPQVRQVEAAYRIDGPAVLATVQILNERREREGVPPEAYPAALRAVIEGAVVPNDDLAA